MSVAFRLWERARRWDAVVLPLGVMMLGCSPSALVMPATPRPATSTGSRWCWWRRRCRRFWGDVAVDVHDVDALVGLTVYRVGRSR